MIFPEAQESLDRIEETKKQWKKLEVIYDSALDTKILHGAENSAHAKAKKKKMPGVLEVEEP